MLIKRDNYVVFFPLEYSYQTLTEKIYKDDVFEELGDMQFLMSPSKDTYDTLVNILASDLVVFTLNALFIKEGTTLKENPEAVMWIRICKRLNMPYILESDKNISEPIKEKYLKWKEVKDGS